MALKYTWSALGEIAEVAARSRAANEIANTFGVALPVDAGLHAAVAELLAGGIGGGGGGGPIPAANVQPGSFPAGDFVFQGNVTTTGTNVTTVNGQTVDATTMLTASQKTALTGGGTADVQHKHSFAGITSGGAATGSGFTVPDLTVTGLLTASGGVNAPLTIRTVTANTTVTATDQIILVDATAGAVTVTLDAATAFGKKEIFIKKIDSSANAATITAAGTDTIDGAASISLATQYASADLVSDGTSKWWQTTSASGSVATSAANVAPGTFQAGSYTVPGTLHVQTTFQADSGSTATFNGGMFVNSSVNYKYFSAGNSGAAITLNNTNGVMQKLTLTGNCTITLAGFAQAGAYMRLVLIQDATGSRTVTWPAAVQWPGGTAPTLTATASKKDVVELFYDGTNYLGRVLGQNY